MGGRPWKAFVSNLSNFPGLCLRIFLGQLISLGGPVARRACDHEQRRITMPIESGEGGDNFSETTHEGWGSRIGASLRGIVVGLAVAAAAGAGLFWNEGRAVQTARSLAEGAGVVVTIDSSRVDPAYEGKLVHATGELKPSGILADTDFNVSAEALRLVRIVEMYQWHEEARAERHKNVGGSEDTTTNYTYAKGWSRSPIDSAKFKYTMGHSNPPMSYTGREFRAETATFGAFKPGAAVLAQVSDRQPLRLTQSDIDRTPGGVPLGRLHLVDGALYHGYDPQHPEVGDLKVSFEVVKGGPVSIVGQQAGSDLVPFSTKAGNALLMVRKGTVPAAEMFAGAVKGNSVMTWILRAVGAFAMYLGFTMVLRPLVVLGDVVPVIGSLVGYGTGLAAAIVTAVLAPAIIALAWLWYRPVVSIIVAAMGLALAWLLRQRGRAARAPAATAGSTPVA